MYRVMLVDDEQGIINALKRVIKRKSDWEVEAFTDPKEALRRAQVSNFELFVSDFRMPEMDGVEFLTEVRKIQPESMRIILSGYTDLEALLGAINKAEIYRFICKPWQDYDLLTVMQQALDHREVIVENRRLADQIRNQQQELENRKTAIEILQDKYPDLFSVDWGDDGSIIVDESQLQ